MDYQRIHKLQKTGGAPPLVSPTKFKTKLTSTVDQSIVIHNNTRSLLTPQDQSQSNNNSKLKKKQQVKRADSAVHPTRSTVPFEEHHSTTTTTTSTTTTNNHECDSSNNTSSLSFEFPNNNGDRARLSRSFSRPASSSKWNDAEKWIINKPTTKHLHRQTSLNQNTLTSTRMSETKTAIDSQVGFSFSQSDEAGPTVRAVSMRDMGTEMTPMASQEPSRASTPMGSTTPLCSSPPPKPEANDLSTEEEEVKLKIRREIIALGIQLGKNNIIATMSAAQQDNHHLVRCATQLNKKRSVIESVSEFEYRAAAWEQVEKTKHEARFKREEVMIQMWESRQKAKLEADMRRIEAKVEEMKFKCQTRMLQKIASATNRSETKRAKAEAKKNQQAQKTATLAGYIRRKGHIPYTYMCCGWA